MPSGRHQLAEEQVRESQRSRLIEAIAALCAERGYANIVITDIVARAAVSKSTFYRFYETKEACLFEAHKYLSAELLASIDSSAQECNTSAEKLRAAIRAGLGFAAVRPEAAGLLTTGILSAGTEGIARYRTTVEAIAQRLPHEGDERHFADALAAVLFSAPLIVFSLQAEDQVSVASLEAAFVEMALAWVERP